MSQKEFIENTERKQVIIVGRNAGKHLKPYLNEDRTTITIPGRYGCRSRVVDVLALITHPLGTKHLRKTLYKETMSILNLPQWKPHIGIVR